MQIPLIETPAIQTLNSINMYNDYLRNNSATDIISTVNIKQTDFKT